MTKENADEDFTAKNDVSLIVGRTIVKVEETFSNNSLTITFDDGSAILVRPDMEHSNGMAFHVDDLECCLHPAEDRGYDPVTMDEAVFDGKGQRITGDWKHVESDGTIITAKNALKAHGATERNKERRQRHEEKRARRHERLAEENAARKEKRKARQARKPVSAASTA